MKTSRIRSEGFLLTDFGGNGPGLEGNVSKDCSSVTIIVDRITYGDWEYSSSIHYGTNPCHHLFCTIDHH